MRSLQKTKNLLKFFSNKTTVVFLTLVVLFLFLAPPIMAAQLDTGLEYGEYSGLSTQDIRISIMKIVRVALGFLGVITIIIIIYGGYTWMTAGGNPEKIDKAKKILTSAVIGLMIILSAFAIVWFIISMLTGALGTPGDDYGPPDNGCDGCDLLGNGILESVYPYALQEDVPRNTSIIVTFKVEMDPETLINDANDDGIFGGDCIDITVGATDDGINNPVCDTIATTGGEPNIKIYPWLQHPKDHGEDAPLDPATVRVISSAGNKIFTFRLIDDLFGSEDTDTWYQVRLTNDIKQSNSESAFGKIKNGFAWRFLIGTHVDLDPPEITDVFPQPDNLPDFYDETDATRAVFHLSVDDMPKVAKAAGNDILNVVVGTNGSSISGTYDGDFTTGVCITVSDDGTSSIIRIEEVALPDDYVAGGEICTLTPNTSNACFLTQNFNNLPEDVGGDIEIGCGLTLNLVGNPDPEASWNVHQWSFSAWPEIVADTLTIDSKVFTFVPDTGGASGNEIGVPDDNSEVTLAANITTKVNATSLGFSAVQISDMVELTATQAGDASNNKPLFASGDWSEIELYTSGADPGFNGAVKGIPDKARNAIVTFDFNEALRPDQALIDLDLDDPSIVPNINVKYQDANNDWQSVEGNLYISNLYRSIDFVPKSKCGVCKSGEKEGNPCSSDVDCTVPSPGTSGTCENAINTCGEEIYCLPVNPGQCHDTTQDCFSNLDCASGVLCDYEPTHYRISITTAKLPTCSSDDGCIETGFRSCLPVNPGACWVDPADLDNGADCASNEDCKSGDCDDTSVCVGELDAGEKCFADSECNSEVCEGLGTGDKSCGGIFSPDNHTAFYPQCNDSPEGIIDAANNIMNGNKNTYIYDLDTNVLRGMAEGGYDKNGQDAYSLNYKVVATGDDLEWEFYVNKDLDLSPPNIVETKPNVRGREVSLKASIDGLFDELLMSSTLKPGSNYNDGLCSCTDANPECAGEGEVCDLTGAQGKCKNKDGEQKYCRQDDDCDGGVCHNKKYLSLLDPRRRTGYWVTKSGIDTAPAGGVTDGYADRNKAYLNHTRFAEVSVYHAEMGYGIRDVYQNCFLPSAGPGTEGHCTLTTGVSCTSNRQCTGQGNNCVGYYDPDTDSNTCSTSRLQPFCCNGMAMTQLEWEISPCFTPY